jgi:hypothetical protein
VMGPWRYARAAQPRVQPATSSLVRRAGTRTKAGSRSPDASGASMPRRDSESVVRALEFPRGRLARTAALRETRQCRSRRFAGHAGVGLLSVAVADSSSSTRPAGWVFGAVAVAVRWRTAGRCIALRPPRLEAGSYDLARARTRCRPPAMSSVRVRCGGHGRRREQPAADPLRPVR